MHGRRGYRHTCPPASVVSKISAWSISICSGFVSEHPCYVWQVGQFDKTYYSGPQHELPSAPGEHDAIHANGTLLEWKRTSRFPCQRVTNYALWANHGKSIHRIHEVIKYRTMIFHSMVQAFCGKTTLRLAGAECVRRHLTWRPRNGDFRKWDGTSAGFKGMFQQRTGIGICLDELGSLLVNDPLQFAYSVTGGQSRVPGNLKGTPVLDSIGIRMFVLLLGEESFQGTARASKAGTKGDIRQTAGY